MKTIASLLASLSLLSVLGAASAQTQPRSLDGTWSGTIRCQKKAVISARLSLRTQGRQVSGTVTAVGVSGMPGARLPRTAAPLSGTRNGNTISFSTPGPGGAPLNLSATVREGGRVLVGGFGPKIGCESFYFSH
ncbi:hypothetical protein [Deinococcus sp.]|uniref:hypothetical protein n=1 Tax=Deinococcus sp. TaxID=47478 RepID=UPI0025EC90C4|nr:hypothetical protein [Deinococcus sp.]